LPIFSESHIDPEVITPKNSDRDEDEEESEYDGNGDEGLNIVAHYHVDVRFLKSEMPIGGSLGIPVSVLAFHDSSLEKIDYVVEWKRKRCFRLPVDDFENSVVPGIYTPGVISKELKLIDKNVCPHQKTCLRGVPKLNNEIVCPAHGLKWDTLSGGLICREPVSNTPYAMAISKEYQDFCDSLGYDYADICDEKNIELEVWNRLPVAIFPYFDRLVFEADREKYL
jgi:Rieske [2Fe-2S] domain